jgi:hypothetical protein
LFAAATVRLAKVGVSGIDRNLAGWRVLVR